MHGGLLCVAFRLSVCPSVCLHSETLVGSLVCLKVQLLATFGLLAVANSNVPKSAVVGLTVYQSMLPFSLTFDLEVTWVEVKGHMGQGQIRVPCKGRWAHDNVKLLHFCIGFRFLWQLSPQISMTFYTNICNSFQNDYQEGVIRVQVPHLTQYHTAVQLNAATTATDVILKFQRRSFVAQPAPRESMKNNK